MILVLSQDSNEPTTEEVVDWVRALGEDAVRLNGDDVSTAHAFRMEVDGEGARLRFDLDGCRFTDREVRVVWLRRWGRSVQPTVRTIVGLEGLAGRMNGHLAAEINAASRALFSIFPRARWLTQPSEGQLSKLAVLAAAARVGLEVPATLVTNRRDEIEAFRARHGRVITKSVGEAEVFNFFGKSFGLYTAEAKDDDVAALPDHVFPSLVQALVPKEFEVRAFYLAGRIHAMAIFSQADAQTSVDFRHYNREKPNRSVPYRLPEEVAERLRALMREVGLETGSLDLIRTPDGRHVFLEVNPAGQFGMVSRPCNYRLEKKVAEYLIERSRADAD